MQKLLQTEAQNFALGEKEKERVFTSAEKALDRALTKGLKKDSQEFQLLIQGIANTHDLSKASTAQLFTATQNALDRAQRGELQEGEQTFRQTLQDDMQDFSVSEAAKERIFKSGVGFLERALKERGIAVQEASLLIDKDYKDRLVGVKELEAQAIDLGKKSDTASINFLTKHVDAYKAGALDKGIKRKFEFVVETFKAERRDPNTGFVTEYKLPKEIQTAIEESLYNKQPSVVKDTSDNVEGQQNVETFQQDFDNQGGYFNKEARASLISNIFKDGVVDLKSEYWSLVPTEIVTPEINYQDARGVLSALPRAGVFLTRLGRDLFGGEPETGTQREFSEAETRIRNLHNKLLSLSNKNLELVSGSGERTLKLVQEQLADTIAPLKGKFTFSETMRDTLSGASSKLANQMQVLADVLPEYGGNSGGYTEAQVTKARNYMQDLVITTAEVLALKRAFDDGKRVLSQTKSDDANNIFKQTNKGEVFLTSEN